MTSLMTTCSLETLSETFQFSLSSLQLFRPYSGSDGTGASKNQFLAPVQRLVSRGTFTAARTLLHRRSQGVQWVHLHPQGGEKIFFRPNLQEKMCKCTPAGHEVHPQPEQESILGVFAAWLRFGGIFRRRRLKKGRQLFWQKRSAPPQTKSWLRLCFAVNWPTDYQTAHHILLWSVASPAMGRGGKCPPPSTSNNFILVHFRVNLTANHSIQVLRSL